MLLEAGASVNFIDCQDGYSTLQLAVLNNLSSAIVSMLVDYGCNIGEPAPYGQTILQLACECECSSQCVSTLIHLGADVNQRNRSGLTPLHCAMHCGSLEIIRRLLEAGADPTVKTPDGQTAADMTKSMRIRSMLTK